MSLEVSLAQAGRGASFYMNREVCHPHQGVDSGWSDRRLEGGHTMNLVLTTHNGFVMIVPVAPAVIAAVICTRVDCGAW